MSPLGEENYCCLPIIALSFFSFHIVSEYSNGKFWIEWRILVTHGSVSLTAWSSYISHTQALTMWPISCLTLFLPLLPAFCFPSSWKSLYNLWDGWDFFYIKVFLLSIFLPSDMWFLIYSLGIDTFIFFFCSFFF